MAYNSVLLIGCGNMAGAMLEGWLAAGIDPVAFTVVDPNVTNVPGAVPVLRELPIRPFDAIVLGIKPDMLAGLAEDIAARAVTHDTVVFSVLAGVELQTLANHFAGSRACVRVMPNLAVAIGKAPLALVGQGLDEAGRAEANGFLQHLGTTEWLPDESQFELVTALTGSGPGFVYRFTQALADAAAELGLDEMQAERMAVQMVEGAAALAPRSGHSPGELARRVASPGGMTQMGLDVLDADDALLTLLRACLAATRDRGIAMAQEARMNGKGESR